MNIASISRRESEKMNIGKACAIFDQINSDKYTEQEKLNAIKQVIEMPTHNGVTKYKILNAFRWFFDWAVEESSQKPTNADRIRSMSDEELTDVILCPYDTAGKPIDIMPCVKDGNIQKLVPPEDCKKCMLEWLQSEAEE